MWDHFLRIQSPGPNLASDRATFHGKLKYNFNFWRSSGDSFGLYHYEPNAKLSSKGYFVNFFPQKLYEIEKNGRGVGMGRLP